MSSDDPLYSLALAMAKRVGVATRTGTLRAKCRRCAHGLTRRDLGEDNCQGCGPILLGEDVLWVVEKPS